MSVSVYLVAGVGSAFARSVSVAQIISDPTFRVRELGGSQFGFQVTWQMVQCLKALGAVLD